MSSDHRVAFRSLAADLRSLFRRWRPGQARGDRRFRDLVLRCFRLQYRGIGGYRRYCDRRGRTPESVTDWREVLPVPAAAFRSVPLVVGDDPAAARVEFRTGGTSRGASDRGRHLVLDTGIYRAALEPPFRHFVLPHRDGAEEARRASEPLIVLATTLAAAEWTERLAARGHRLELPRGSRLMDTGGAKGREGLERSDVLEEVPEGEAGVLCHHDLANAGSVSVVLTADRGRVRDGRVQLLGRSVAVGCKGCK